MYDYAQTFKIDSAAVKGAKSVNISKVELWFKSKPNIGSETEKNMSGIFKPGVQVTIVKCHGDGTPDLTEPREWARVEYDEINTSAKADAKTVFRFPKEKYILTDKRFAVYVQFDGREDFKLWSNKKGEYYVGTNQVSPGESDRSVVNLYRTKDRLTSGFDPTAPGGAGANEGVDDKATWVPLQGEDLKFKVYVARYRETADTNSPVTTNYNLDPRTYDFIAFDGKHSPTSRNLLPAEGEWIFQLNPLASNNGVPYTINAQKGSTTITSPDANFDTLFPTDKGDYLVIVSENHQDSHPSGDRNRYDVVRINSKEGNSATIDRALRFTNSAANFMIAPVARLDYLMDTRSYADASLKTSWYWGDRKRSDMAVLKNSKANVSTRFVNNSIHSISINAAGQGYSNTDYILITSGDAGSINAYANVRTNASGNLTTLYLTNAGAGFLTQPTVVVMANSTSQSTGSGATFSLVEGPWLKSEIIKYTIKDVNVIDLEVDTVSPAVFIRTPEGSSYTLKHQLLYYKDNSGNYIINPTATSDQQEVDNFSDNMLNYNKVPVLLSRSHEVVQLQSTSGNSTHIVLSYTSNNDFIDPTREDCYLEYGRYSINNDYTNEHTSFGAAAAKHIMKKVTFSEGKLAEDMVVYLRAYRPPGTDFKVYAKLYNSQDEQAFDDKDWTLLEVTEGENRFSSAKNKDDLREFTYGIPLSPNTTMISAGTVTLQSSNSTVTGLNTNFISEGEGFAAGDLVKIYDPIFDGEKYFITSVNSVTNSTSLVLDDTTDNTSVIGTGLKIARLDYKNQAFRNINNDNVVRYYNTSMHTYDGYDTYSIKIVLLSESQKVIPEVEDMRVIGVSA